MNVCHMYVQVMADVSAALPSESALRRERQARWDSDVSEGSSHEDKVRTIKKMPSFSKTPKPRSERPPGQEGEILYFEVCRTKNIVWRKEALCSSYIYIEQKKNVGSQSKHRSSVVVVGGGGAPGEDCFSTSVSVTPRVWVERTFRKTTKPSDRYRVRRCMYYGTPPPVG